MAQVVESVARYFSLLAEPMRIRILQSICREEKTVSQIVADTGATQTNISRHLNTMYQSGVLSRRKQGTFTYYGVGDEVVTEMCRTMCVHIASKVAMSGQVPEAFISFARDLDGTSTNTVDGLPAGPPGPDANTKRNTVPGAGRR
ncbi:MAG: winged helix-turn-helix transcriptional regulator [Burkholderiaceae bacterium]|nr:winged helix-turn-helix transcriptional regulator [Burkholderiaceae bacterium]